MARYNKKYIRMIRTDLGRFPVWPLQQKVALGDVLMFHGRKSLYSWHGNLTQWGISVTPTGAQTLLNEYYETEHNVSMKLGPGVDCVVADFKFMKKSAVVAQSFEQVYSVLPIEALKAAINQRFSPADKQWNTDWLIVTELWQAEAYTTLISGGNGGEAIIKSGGLIPLESFNIANPRLNLSVSSKKNMNYIALAEQAVCPFFRTHRLIRYRGQYALRAYGEG